MTSEATGNQPKHWRDRVVEQRGETPGNVEVQLFKEPDPSNTLFIKVRLHSFNKRGLVAEARVNDQGDLGRTRQMIMATAGELAEHLNREYADQHDMVEIAKASLELFDAIMSELQQSTRH